MPAGRGAAPGTLVPGRVWSSRVLSRVCEAIPGVDRTPVPGPPGGSAGLSPLERGPGPASAAGQSGRFQPRPPPRSPGPRHLPWSCARASPAWLFLAVPRAGGPGAPGARGRRLAAGRELAVRMNESMNESMTRMNGRRSGALPGKISSKRANPAFWGGVAPLHEAGARSDVGGQDPERGVGKREWLGAGWECRSAFSCPRGGA